MAVCNLLIILFSYDFVCVHLPIHIISLFWEFLKQYGDAFG